MGASLSLPWAHRSPERVAPWTSRKKTEEDLQLTALKPPSPRPASPIEKLQAIADGKLLFDAHCHFFSYRQQTEGLDVLVDAMKQAGVGFAALTGCPFKKTWMNQASEPPEHHLYDDGDLYYYSMTDAILHRDLQMADPAIASHFAMLACGFNLGDAGAGIEAQAIVDHFPIVGFGEVTLQSDDINNMTIKGGNWVRDDRSNNSEAYRALTLLTPRVCPSARADVL
jgi:hypothetical protein